MDNPNDIIFNCVKPWLKEPGFNAPGRIDALNEACERFRQVVCGGVITTVEERETPYEQDELTLRGALELAGHEGLIQEWYKDSVNVGTWSIGITNASGHNVDRYKDNPQSIEDCLEVYIWLLRQGYMPDVIAAFKGHELTEEQLHAATSFHYNTGKILQTDWVKLFLQGKLKESEEFLRTHYLNGGDLQERRDKEADLFFKGIWSGDGMTNIYKVNKPSYTPNWGSVKRTDISKEMQAALDAS